MTRTSSMPTKKTLPVPPQPVSGTESSPRPETTQPVTRFFKRLFRISASLQLAISLLSLFTLCLIGATLLEAAYNAQIATDLIYHTWWFFLLLVLLAVNILCAALKKYPWKRHQTGFLVTHLGLIVLVLGGLVTNIGGTEGQLSMIDTENQDIQEFFAIPNRADTIQMARRHQLEICRVPQSAHQNQVLLEALIQAFHNGQEVTDALKEKIQGSYWSLDFWPGSLPWYADEHLQPNLPRSLCILKSLANPSPEFQKELSQEVELQVENFYPHTRSQPFRVAKEDEEDFPALQIALQAPMMKKPMKQWVTSLPNFLPDGMPVTFEMFKIYDEPSLQEFLHPPTEKEMGKLGQLVVRVGGEAHRLKLDDLKLGKAVDLGKTGLKLKIKHVANLMLLLGQGGHGAHGKAPKGLGGPFYPAVQFELAGKEGRGTYLVCARMPHMPPYQSGDDVADVMAWYHYPDFRWKQKEKKGSIQFLRGPEHRLYYRVYGEKGLKGPGKELKTEDNEAAHAIPWGPMNMEFKLLKWLPRAKKQQTVLPVDVPPGAELTERLQPALRCILTNEGETTDFLVRMSRRAAKVVVGSNIFFVRYRLASRKLDFSLSLKKAQQINDPGTNRPASYQSDVVLHYKENGKKHEKPHQIYMNHTLDYGPYKIYQTQYRPMIHPKTMQMIIDEKGKLVSLSGLTVAHDPGLWLKYVGSGLLVLGIAIMFYMRAYFFKPKAKAA